VGDEVEDGLESDTPMGRNIIVAIGINQYQHQPQLDNPINDAQVVSALFKQCGFQELPGVPPLLDNEATRAAMAALPDQLADELAADDNLVLFFAGHGDKVERQAPDPAQPGKTYTHRTGYLIPADGPQNKPSEWVRLDAFLDDISGLPARHIFVILDACKSGIALADKFKVKGGGQPTAVASLRRLPSRRVMTSARHDEKAAEGGSGSGHSVFTEALIAAIQDRQADKDGDGYIKTVDLFSFVQDHVSERADRLFKLRQTPDYGYLPGDGSGDLVISLHEGAFNRLIQKAMEAMLRHDVPRLEELVGQLSAANPDYPTTIYLQFRLHFMRGNLGRALEAVSDLELAKYQEGTIPLSKRDLRLLRSDIDRWQKVLGRPVGTPPVEVRLLTGTDPGELAEAPFAAFPGGDAYQIEDGATAQFEVRNKGAVRAHLYFIAIVPHGRFRHGPLLESDECRTEGLAPGAVERGPRFKVEGSPGSVTETRIYYSTSRISRMLFPDSPASAHAGGGSLDPGQLQKMQMTRIWHQISMDPTSSP